jgi:hypothetical protein
VIYIPSFIQIGSGIQKLMGGGGDTRTQTGDLISLLYFFFFSKYETYAKTLYNEFHNSYTLPNEHYLEAEITNEMGGDMQHAWGKMRYDYTISAGDPGGHRPLHNRAMLHRS